MRKSPWQRDKVQKFQQKTEIIPKQNMNINPTTFTIKNPNSDYSIDDHNVQKKAQN